MAKRWLRLLGPTRINEIQEDSVSADANEADDRASFRSQRTVALLGYLVIQRRPVTRDHLAALFWPNLAPSKRRANLRRELYNLAQLLPGCWSLDAQTAAFVSSAETEVDLYRLLKLLAHERWDEAVELLGGEFMEGLYLTDNLEFERWLQAEREKWRGYAERVLAHVINKHTRRGRYTEGLNYALRQVQLSPWDEEAHRQVMRLLAWTGKRGAALRQFEACKQVLWEELDVEPAEETITLYQMIYDGKLAVPPQLPAFLTEEEARLHIDRPPFVAREQELTRLNGFLNNAIAGRGGVVFVTGGPGRGKTALMNEFAFRSMEAEPHLLVVSGNCSAYSGLGDPYLPFREAMAMLTGDVEAKWDAGAITLDHAQRLWDAFPHVVKALLDKGPQLLDVMIPTAALLSRVTIATEANAPTLVQLRKHISNQQTSAKDGEQSYLFQAAAAVLRTVAQARPLLLTLDDVQWADTASISLLFHLARRLKDSRVLIACAYRPEEVVLGRDGERHPLAKIVNEIKRSFGDIWIRLESSAVADNRAFVDALLDSEPNRLPENFRRTLYRRTEGHPLFTTELLRTMTERGDLFKDEQGQWTARPMLNWEILPARVEAVIAERLNRLEPDLQRILVVASVEGELFTLQVVAEVQKVAIASLLRQLSDELERRHRLVKEQEEVQTAQGRLSRYRFRHVLFQEYLYQALSPGERRMLHRDVATAIEKLYVGQLDEPAVQLGHHFREAGEYSRALPYFIRAAKNAARVHANDEAIVHYTQAIDLANSVIDEPISLAKLHRGRGLARQTLGEFDGARADLETALDIAHRASDQQLEWRLLIDLGKAWTSRDYQRARDYFEGALDLARNLNDASLLAGGLNWMGNWHANAERPVNAAEYHKEALTIFGQLGEHQPGLAKTLDLLGLAYLLGGDHVASVGYYDRAIALLRELGDRQRLISSLVARGTNGSLLVLSVTVPAILPSEAKRDIEAAIQIAREIHSPAEEAWAGWSLGLLYIMTGQYGRALEVLQRGLRIAIELGHSEWTVGNQFALGLLYIELMAPDRAQRQLEQALSLAERLQSQYWLHHVIGAFAAVHLMQNDPRRAQACLDSVLSPETPMDTMGKRYCWGRRAQLALFQGGPSLALKIAAELIASAPGLQTGKVVTFLWQLQAESFAAVGDTEQAERLLQAAVNNAQALRERFLLWRVHASLGRLYFETNRQEDARGELSLASELVQELAVAIADQELRDNFLERAHKTFEIR